MPNHTYKFTFSLRISHSSRFGAGDTYLPTGIRTAAVPYESTPASLHIHALHMNLPYLQWRYARYDQHSRINIAESAIPHRIFWLQWNMADKLTREAEMGVCFSIRVVYIAVRFLRIPPNSGWYVKMRLSHKLYNLFEMPSIQIESVQYVLVVVLLLLLLLLLLLVVVVVVWWWWWCGGVVVLCWWCWCWW